MGTPFYKYISVFVKLSGHLVIKGIQEFLNGAGATVPFKK